MRKAILMTTALAAAVLLLAACGKKGAEGPSPDSLKADIAAVTGELNGYLDGHNFSNTEAGTLSAELKKLAGKYGELQKQAEELKKQSGDEEFGDLGALAGEGRAKAEALAGALAEGPPMGDPAKMTALNGAVDEWVDYSDKVGPPAGGETPEPGDTPEPGETPEPGDTPGPGHPGRGKHLGWWNNPDWARDCGTRGADGETPGTGEMERERERERERDREHMGSGPGSGGGRGPGSGAGGGAGSGGAGGGKGPGGGKGGGGKGGGGKGGGAAGGGAGGGK